MRSINSVLPEGAELRWEDINFFQNDFSEDIGDVLFGERKMCIRDSSYSASLTASMRITPDEKSPTATEMCIRDRHRPAADRRCIGNEKTALALSLR